MVYHWIQKKLSWFHHHIGHLRNTVIIDNRNRSWCHNQICSCNWHRWLNDNISTVTQHQLSCFLQRLSLAHKYPSYIEETFFVYSNLQLVIKESFIITVLWYPYSDNMWDFFALSATHYYFNERYKHSRKFIWRSRGMLGQNSCETRANLEQKSME